jgi:lipopolysaccharide export system protein LptA
MARIYSIFLFFLLNVLLTGAAWSQTTVSGVGSAPLEITSQRLEADGALREVVFSGKVVAVQDGMIIRSNKLIVRYFASREEISSVEAVGEVRIEKSGRIATAGRGLYEVAEGTVVLTETPRVQQGENSIEGDEIVFFLEEDRSIVKSRSGSRVRAVLTPKEKTVGP